MGRALREPNEETDVDETQAGSLVLVATPLGNLGDLSARALELFRTANVIYCEDTRHSRVLFSANHIPSGGRLETLHEHNEAAQSAHIVERVRAGEHFPTDVIAGSMAGSAIGVLVPHLHRHRDEPPTVWIGASPAPGGGSLALRGVF